MRSCRSGSVHVPICAQCRCRPTRSSIPIYGEVSHEALVYLLPVFLLPGSIFERTALLAGAGGGCALRECATEAVCDVIWSRCSVTQDRRSVASALACAHLWAFRRDASACFSSMIFGGPSAHASAVDFLSRTVESGGPAEPLRCLLRVRVSPDPNGPKG
jgi:hypothetical protein